LSIIENDVIYKNFGIEWAHFDQFPKIGTNFVSGFPDEPSLRVFSLSAWAFFAKEELQNTEFVPICFHFSENVNRNQAMILTEMR